MPILVYDAQDARRDGRSRGRGPRPGWRRREHFAARGGIPASGIEAGRRPGRARRLPDGPRPVRHHDLRRVVGPTLRLLDGGREGLARRPGADAPHADRGRGRGRAARRSATGPAASGWWPTTSTAARSPARSTPGPGPRRPASAPSTWPRTSPASRSRSRPSTAATPSTSAAPWTQGPCLLEALQLLEGFDLEPIGHNSGPTPST